jgi:hypothetical protein
MPRNGLEGLSRHPLTQLEIIGPIYTLLCLWLQQTTHSYTKTKMVLSGVWCLLTADDCCYGDQNTWNRFSGSELNICQTIWLLNNRIEWWITEMNGTEQNWTRNNWHKQWYSNNKHWLKWGCNTKGWNVTIQHLQRVKYLCDYGTDNYNAVLPRY